jgi:hypothetical protein
MKAATDPLPLVPAIRIDLNFWCGSPKARNSVEMLFSPSLAVSTSFPSEYRYRTASTYRIAKNKAHTDWPEK